MRCQVLTVVSRMLRRVVRWKLTDVSETLMMEALSTTEKSVSLHWTKRRNTPEEMWDFKFSRRRVWCSELSSGMYCRVKWLSTDVLEVRTWRQYAPLKRRSTIILHGSTSQKTTLNTPEESLCGKCGLIYTQIIRWWHFLGPLDIQRVFQRSRIRFQLSPLTLKNKTVIKLCH
jgi:hypothetical protein